MINLTSGRDINLKYHKLYIPVLLILWLRKNWKKNITLWNIHNVSQYSTILTDHAHFFSTLLYLYFICVAVSLKTAITWCQTVQNLKKYPYSLHTKHSAHYPASPPPPLPPPVVLSLHLQLLSLDSDWYVVPLPEPDTEYTCIANLWYHTVTFTNFICHRARSMCCLTRTWIRASHLQV